MKCLNVCTNVVSYSRHSVGSQRNDFVCFFFLLWHVFVFALHQKYCFSSQLKCTQREHKVVRGAHNIASVEQYTILTWDEAHAVPYRQHIK